MTDSLHDQNETRMRNQIILSKTSKNLILLGVLLLIPGVSILPVLADSNHNITINPVEIHKVGDVFEFSGMTTITDPEILYIDIVPTQDYENLKLFVAETWGNENTGLWIEDSKTNPGTMYTITRVNPDGTNTTIESPVPHDEFSVEVPILKNQDGDGTWKFYSTEPITKVRTCNLIRIRSRLKEVWKQIPQI
ncbi:MAG TPA: hypothetical protein VN372_12510 [Methanospirillum sp.]|nr:hypothetical protein [Methanospirillum sp.]